MMNLKGLRLLLFAMFLSVAFISCKDDKDPDPVKEEEVNKSEVVGSWKVTTVTPENPSESIPALALLPSAAPCYNQLVLTFTSASKISTTGCDQLINLMAQANYLTLGTETSFKTENGNLVIANGSNSQTFKYTLAGTDLKIFVDTDLTPTGTKNIVLLLKKQ